MVGAQWSRDGPTQHRGDRGNEDAVSGGGTMASLSSFSEGFPLGKTLEQDQKLLVL